jgi:hypothetical protein
MGGAVGQSAYDGKSPKMNVNDAIESIYRAFSVKKRPTTISACPCCHDQNEVCGLLKTPLRQITPSQLSAYAASVFLTAGSEKDFRYFLPRILEISYRDRHWWPDREAALGKLALANWLDWSAPEIDALQSFFDVAFDEAIASDDDAHYEADSWICGLALAGADVKPFLRKLEVPAVEQVLFGFFELNAAALPKGKLGNAFWNGNDVLAEPIIAWFKSSTIQSVVWRHYGATG